MVIIRRLDGKDDVLRVFGQVLKVAACKAKPYELRERELEKNEEQKKEGEGNYWNKWIDEDENKENENVG